MEIKLYKKDKNEKLLIWFIEIEDDKYRTYSGQLDGTLTISNWTTALPKNVGKKNETSGKDQAIKEVEAKIKKKLEEGYTKNIDEAKLQDHNIQECVMLAEKYSNFINTIPDNEFIYVQPKLDGVRSRMVSLEDKSLISRKNKPFLGIPHIIKELQEVNLLLDGELYNHELKEDFNTIISIVRKLKPTKEDLELSEKLMQYHIYDCVTTDKFSVRYDKLSALFKKHNFKYLKLVPTYQIKKDQVIEYHNKFVNEGYEGIIIRRDANYEFFRSKNLLKYKVFVDKEFEIVDVIEGVGNRSGMMGKLLLRLENGSTFEANSKGDFTYYKELLENKHLYIGKYATVKYQNLTPEGVPRFGVVTAIRDYE